MADRYEYMPYASNIPTKFWVIGIVRGINRYTVTTRYGKIGATGTVRHCVFSTAYEANKYKTKKINEKVLKGYTLVYDNTTSVSEPTQSPTVLKSKDNINSILKAAADRIRHAIPTVKFAEVIVTVITPDNFYQEKA